MSKNKITIDVLKKKILEKFKCLQITQKILSGLKIVSRLVIVAVSVW